MSEEEERTIVESTARIVSEAVRFGEMEIFAVQSPVLVPVRNKVFVDSSLEVLTKEESRLNEVSVTRKQERSSMELMESSTMILLSTLTSKVRMTQTATMMRAETMLRRILRQRTQEGVRR